MKNNLTEIIILLDSSGSMEKIWDDATGSVTSFVKQQQETPGEARLTVTCFNSSKISTIIDNENIQNVVNLKFNKPSGGTPLLDALGSTIAHVKARYDSTPDDEKPSLVLFYIVSDGQENSSHTLTKADVVELIKSTQERYDWNYTYACADLDTYEDAINYGISAAQNTYSITKKYMDSGDITDNQWVSTTSNVYGNYVSQLRTSKVTSAVPMSSLSFADYATHYFGTNPPKPDDSDNTETPKDK